jgi:hypothetical protein
MKPGKIKIASYTQEATRSKTAQTVYRKSLQCAREETTKATATGRAKPAPIRGREQQGVIWRVGYEKAIWLITCKNKTLHTNLSNR